jgi:glycosyltransferase involved in cell wall biosynthesis
LFAGSDEDFSEHYYPGSQMKNFYGSSGHLCHYAIMQADSIVTQTALQARLLEERFGRTSVTVGNPVDLSTSSEAAQPPGGHEIALWVGKSDKVKRPDIMLQLAAQFKEIDFVLVLNRSDLALFDHILRVKPSNVQILESIDFREMESLFARAFVLINTSLFEGFPNTFLQAGKYGVPILSLQVDPDGFVEKHRCGIVAKGEVAILAEGLRRLISDSSLRKTCSENIKSYILSHHEANARVSQLNQFLKGLLPYGV